MATLDDLGNLVGQDSMAIESSLIFSHPALENDLVVRSGAHSINWSYELNQQTTPTIGGEVVQILSCFVGPMTITGEAGGMRPNRDPRLPTGWGSYTPAREMEHIVGWFLKYMEAAGTIQGTTERRNETAVRFMYPARGWDFLIQPIDLQGFDVAWDQVTVPWSISAEVVSDKALDYFVASTMNTFTDSITNRLLLQQAISPGKDYLQNPFINPSLSSANAGSYAQRIGDNFQSLIASWATGDFMTWGYDATGDNPNISKDPYDAYGSTFGGWYVGDKQNFSEWSGEFTNVSAAPEGTLGSASLPVNMKDAIYGATLKKYIVCGCRDRNMDPAAVFSMIFHEGNFSGAVGDNGSSFGPWQLHGGQSDKSWNGIQYTNPSDAKVLGKLPQEVWDKGPKESARWANSPQGLDYAMNSLAGAIAGKTGYLAVVAIAQWEISTDIEGQAARAWADYPKAKKETDAIDCSVEVILPAAGEVRQVIRDYLVRAVQSAHVWDYSSALTGQDEEPEAYHSTDCSGLTLMAYRYAKRITKKNVPDLPHSSSAQAAGGNRISSSGPFLIGDLAEYLTPGHVVICMEAGDAESAVWASHGSTPGPLTVSVNYRPIHRIARYLP